MNARRWLLLVTHLKGRNQTLRMRIWRALKASGAASLRDGVYLLPNSQAARHTFGEQIRDLEAGSGQAHVFGFDADSPEQQAALNQLFDRRHEYQTFLDALEILVRDLKAVEEAQARRRLAALRRDLSAIVATDFFGGEGRSQAESALGALSAALDRCYSPDEPQSVAASISRRDPKRYRGRIWATRERPWIDRVCSAWLIRRFIDSKAKFLWLKQTKDCPKKAVGFDFDGAEFTHVGDKVTFEVLQHSFGLQQDVGLCAMAALVHFLDVGGLPVPEAAGFAAVVGGARSLHASDDSLLAAISPVLDSLYASYATSKER